MLRELKIRNLAIIETTDLTWGPGFTAVTGETGAGKSILLNALKFILGAKVKIDLIRQGADKLKVEAVFDIPPSKGLRAVFTRLELDPGSDDIVLERELSPSGKNRCRVNGSVVTTAALEEIGTHLVDLHGQHHQQSLLDPATHLDFLDGFARLDGPGESYAQAWRVWKDIGDRLREAETTAQRVREQFEFLSFQSKELEKAPLAPGQEEEIESNLKMQNFLEKIGSGLQSSLSILEGEEGDILGNLARLHREVQNLGKLIAPNPFEEHVLAMESARTSLADLKGALRGFRLPQTADASRLDELNAKLALIQKLKSKYHTDMVGLVELRDRRRSELQNFGNSEADIVDLKEKLAHTLTKALSLAKGLSENRHAASRAFDAEVNRMLKALGMEGATFQTRINSDLPSTENPTRLTNTGYDLVEYFLAANPGEPAKPLKQIASGGEISRIMLAIKSALAQSDPRPLLVFDELDSGIGGVTANRVGEALKELAGHHQLIVITHLHQVAAQASQHSRVIKVLEGGRTATRVISLSAKERIQELARMMGDESSPSTLKHAKELLAQ